MNKGLESKYELCIKNLGEILMQWNFKWVLNDIVYIIKNFKFQYLQREQLFCANRWIYRRLSEVIEGEKIGVDAWYDVQ